jgi:tetratricopeptide (TPR) repeat protein
MIVPGFVEAPTVPNPNRLTATVVGRLDRVNDKIKQVTLAAAAFGRAIQYSHDTVGGVESLRQNPTLKILGIPAPDGIEEKTIRAVTADRAKAAVNVIPLVYDENRQTVLRELRSSSMVLMPSWHEGFGLVGWEAIACEVPLVLSRQSGVWELLRETLGETMATAYTSPIRVRGSEDAEVNFVEDDEIEMRDAIVTISANLIERTAMARKLKEELVNRLGCTWENAAKTFLASLSVKAAATTVHVDAPLPVEQPSLEIPESSWPKSLSDRGLTMPDSLLLRAESRVVRFSSARKRLKEAVVTWALGNPERLVKVRLQAGAGGVGKTRLLIEVCDELVKFGWAAGFATHGWAPSDFRRPQLIVFDYAESRTREIAALVKAALRSRAPDLVRIVLLAREGGDWWDRIAEAAGSDHLVAAMLRDVNTTAGPFRMDAEEIPTAQRIGLFREACDDFSRHLGLSFTAPDEPDLSDPAFSTPLYIHLYALAHVRQITVTPTQLLRSILAHERSYWRHVIESSGGTDVTLDAIEEALALVTLVGGKRSAKDTRNLLSRHPPLATQNMQSLFSVMAQLYPDEGGIAPLRPDILGETLVAEALARDDELLDTALGNTATREEARTALTVLTRLAKRSPDETRWLTRALARHLAGRTAEAVAVGLEAGAPLPQVLINILQRADRAHISATVDSLRGHIPENAIGVAGLRTEVVQQSLKMLDGRRSGGQRSKDRGKIEMLVSLSRSLGDENRHSEQYQVAIIARDFALNSLDDNRLEDRYLLAIAHAHVNMAASALGRFTDGYAAGKAALDIFESLSSRDGERYDVGYGDILGNLSNTLISLRRFDSAYDLRSRAVEVWRRCAARSPTRFSIAHAASLVELGTCERLRGNNSDALEHISSGEELILRLLDKSPSGDILQNLIRCRISKSKSLWAIGNLREALKISSDAETLSRTLYSKQPDAYEPLLADNLSTVSAALAKLGQFENAYLKELGAEEMVRALRDRHPDTFEGRLADLQVRVGARLVALGRFDEAITKLQHGRRTLEALVEREPEAFALDLIDALDSLAGCYRQTGRFEEALTTLETAEFTLRNIANADQRSFSDEARSLVVTRALTLRDMGRYDDAIRLFEQISTESTEHPSSRLQADLEWACNACNVAESYVLVGRHTSAIDIAREALKAFEAHSLKYPGSNDAWLAFSHRIIAEASLELGAFDDAEMHAHESVERWFSALGSQHRSAPEQVAKSFHALVAAQSARGSGGIPIISSFARAVAELGQFAEHGPTAVRTVLREMFRLASGVDYGAASAAVPERLRTTIVG